MHSEPHNVACEEPADWRSNLFAAGGESPPRYRRETHREKIHRLDGGAVLLPCYLPKRLSYAIVLPVCNQVIERGRDVCIDSR